MFMFHTMRPGQIDRFLDNKVEVVKLDISLSYNPPMTWGFCIQEDEEKYCDFIGEVRQEIEEARTVFKKLTAVTAFKVTKRKEKILFQETTLLCRN